jgi:hypothetical protein
MGARQESRLGCEPGREYGCSKFVAIRH